MMNEQGYYVTVLILCTYAIVSLALLLKALSLALQACFGNPLSTGWVRVNAALKPVDGMENMLCEAEYCVDGTICRKIIRRTSDAESVRLYVRRNQPKTVWKPPFGGSRIAAIAVLLTVIAVIAAAFYVLRPIMIPAQIR